MSLTITGVEKIVELFKETGSTGTIYVVIMMAFLFVCLTSNVPLMISNQLTTFSEYHQVWN
jgi:hypothetical protein